MTSFYSAVCIFHGTPNTCYNRYQSFCHTNKSTYDLITTKCTPNVITMVSVRNCSMRFSWAYRRSITTCSQNEDLHQGIQYYGWHQVALDSNCYLLVNSCDFCNFFLFENWQEPISYLSHQWRDTFTFMTFRTLNLGNTQGIIYIAIRNIKVKPLKKSAAKIYPSQILS